MRVCAEPGCPALQAEPRCLEHRRQREAERGTRQQRGYDAEYQRQLKSTEYVNATRCCECGAEFTADNPKTGGHSVAIRDGGRGSRVVAQCRRCNYGWQCTGL